MTTMQGATARAKSSANTPAAPSPGLLAIAVRLMNNDMGMADTTAVTSHAAVPLWPLTNLRTGSVHVSPDPSMGGGGAGRASDARFLLLLERDVCPMPT